jgi:hypothetical protein
LAIADAFGHQTALPHPLHEAINKHPGPAHRQSPKSLKGVNEHSTWWPGAFNAALQSKIRDKARTE